MTISVVVELATSGVGALDMSLSFDGADLTIAYGYETEESCWTGAIKFQHVAVFRYANESHAKAFPPEAYDSVVEVHESEWLIEFRGPGVASPQWPFMKRHFAVLVSNSGFLEVIAERVEALSPRRRSGG